MSGVLLLASAAAHAETLRMTINGTFNNTAGAGHPDIHVGDTFSYSVTFDRTQINGEGTLTMTVFGASMKSTQLLINGTNHPVQNATQIQMIADRPDPDYAFSRSARLS